MKRAVLALLVLAAASPAAAQVKAGDLTIKDAVMRAVATGVPNTAGYLTIVNAGSRSDRLLSVSCACARSVELHLSHVMDGTAMMMPAGPVELPAGRTVSFAPGGYHLMVMGLKTPLVDGGSQEFTLKFEHAGEVKAPFAVKAKIGGEGPRSAAGRVGEGASVGHQSMISKSSLGRGRTKSPHFPLSRQ